ncbi:MAG: PAS domain-containing protein [Alphaproteobacteria bacterium]|nr:PAS domain-containing protein [Alphaproteobacteria bacterium]
MVSLKTADALSFDPSGSRDPMAPSFHAFWTAGRDAAGRFPAVRFDAAAAPPESLPHLFVLKIHRDPLRFEAKLLADPVADAAGVQAPGVFLDALVGSEPAQGRLARAAARNSPYAVEGVLQWGAYAGRRFVACAAPLHGADGRPAYIAGALRVEGLGGAAGLGALGRFALTNLPRREAPVLDRAFDYWLRKRKRRAMPARAAIDPGEIKDILPHVLLLRVRREPLDFEYRLIGGHFQDFVRPGLRGKSFRRIEGKGPGSALWEGLETVVRTRLARFGRAPYAGPRENVVFQDLMLPFSADGETVSDILVAGQFWLEPRPVGFLAEAL